MYVGNCISIKNTTDTLEFRDILIWELNSNCVGIQIGYGSEVRINGGRIIGKGNRHDNSIGIHCTGNNGGVHIVDTDIIALEYGIVLDNTIFTQFTSVSYVGQIILIIEGTSHHFFMFLYSFCTYTPQI